MSSSTAIFACSDIEATLAYYKDVLGFGASWTWGEPPNFGGASMDGISIFFNLQPDLAERVRGHEHWFSLDDADELYQRHKANGANIISEIEDRPWGFREYVVEDMNGYYLRFAGPLSANAPKSQPLPEGITLERRTPTSEECDKIAKTTLLEGTWGGVVALSPDGETIGILRIMHDAPGWFSIWDVTVVPEWQARRIGSTMMREALTTIREASPGANVHLFTVKHGFYERLGFREETVSIRRV